MYSKNFEMGGCEYPLTYTAAVDMAVESKYGKGLKAMLASGLTEPVLFIFHQMMLAGQRWARRNNIPCLDVPDINDIADMIDAETQHRMITAMGELFAGSDRQVLAKPGKKAEAGV